MYKLFFLFFLYCNLFSQNLVDFNLINTGSNMTVAILGINDDLVEDGDTLAVFYDLSNKKVSCGGFVIWNSERVALTVWGDDSTSSEKDGFLNSEDFLPIFHIKNDSIRKALNAKFLTGNSLYIHNGISVIEVLD